MPASHIKPHRGGKATPLGLIDISSKNAEGFYHREGRSIAWKQLMKKVRKLVKKRAKNYWKHQKRPDALRAFFKNAKAYGSREKPPAFNVASLFDGSLSNKQVA